MRGELDDALDRMARMEELTRRRSAEHTERPAGEPAGIAEVIEAVRRVVAQHPRLRVALWAEEGSAGAGVRVEWLNGELIVLPDEEDPPPTTTGAHHAVTPARATEPVVAPARATEPVVAPARATEPVVPARATEPVVASAPATEPVSPARAAPLVPAAANGAPGAAATAAPRRRGPEIPVPAAWPAPPPVPQAPADAGWAPDPLPSPTTWVPDAESDNEESAARLAELIRRDPSLLRAPEDPYRRR
ncbi:hypothetical protein ACFFWC_30580 [Plantactinospora siamensis]|uniref:Uncharacterized protein n=1 Tax=Plantactinospora siamensis TaxID=555372 RepID=A0ABV6P645_9ACTN